MRPASFARRFAPHLSAALAVLLLLSRRTAASASDAKAKELPPLGGVSWIERLALSHGGEAYVTPPVGAREPRPLIVAVHGAGDRAEWSCGGWRIASRGYAFVVCPQGVKMDAERFAWDSPKTLARRVRDAIDAVHARFGEYVADGPALYAGFSQGAILAVPVLTEEPGRFARAVLAEGGYEWLRDVTALRRVHDAGISRALFVCGSPYCFQIVKHLEERLALAGIMPLTGGDPRSGHNLNQRMQDALRKVWPDVVRDLPAWRRFPVVE